MFFTKKENTCFLMYAILQLRLLTLRRHPVANCVGPLEVVQSGLFIIPPSP